MIRNGMANNAIFAGLIESPLSGDGLLFESRSAVGSPLNWVALPTPVGATWLRLTDSSGTVSAYYSTTGTTWLPVGSPTSLPLGSSPLVGLAVTSASSNTSSAVFSNVSIIPSTGPVVASPPTASVSGTSVALSAVGSDPAGAVSLTYSWSAVGNLASGVSFSANGTNAAKNTTVTFPAAGMYDIRVVATDASGLSAISDTTVTVVQTLTSIAITPAGFPANLAITTGGVQQYSAVASDQFGMAMSFQPAMAWSSNAGSINSYTGLFTAPTTTQSVTLTASTGSLNGTLVVAVKSLGLFPTSQDVGSPTLAGFTNYSSGVYTIAGAGSDIWIATDQFQFAYESLTGDGTIEARVVSLQNTNSGGHSKAGVMIRNSLSANSAFADAVLTYSAGVEFDYRTSTGGGPNRAGIVTPATGPYWVELTRAGNIFAVQVAPDNSGSPGTWTVLSSSTLIAMNQTVYVGLCVSSVNTAQLNTAVIDNVTVTSQGRTLSRNQDIGSPALAGSYTQNAGVATLTGSGLDIYSASDQFQFAYVPISGNVTIIARLASIPSSGSTPNAKAGVMIRNTLASGSQQADVVISPSNSARFDYRGSTNGSTGESKTTGTSIPYWVKLVRSGNSFSAFLSTNGTTWTALGSTQTIIMDSTVLVGLALTSCNTGALATATFDNISITGSADAAPTIATGASASMTTLTSNSVNLSVLGADTDGGGESNLAYTWSCINAPALVTFSSNGTNSAKSSTVAFSQAGTYTFAVVTTDQGNLTAASNVTVTVNQNFSGIAFTPVLASVSPLGTLPLSATAVDQFGNPLLNQPVFNWTVLSGGGSVSNGTYTAPLTGSSAVIQASSGTIAGTTSVQILNQPPLLASSVGATVAITSPTSASLNAVGVDDSGAANLIYTWSAIAPPLPVSFSANGTNAAQNTVANFNAIGTYNLQLMITDPGGLFTIAATSVTISTIAGTQGNDSIRLVRSGLNLLVYVNASSYSVPYDSLSAITISGGAGDDTINIDFSGGATPVPIGGITVDGTGGTDVLTLTGTAGTDTASIGTGTITFDGSGINYLNCQSIQINGNGGADSLVQTAQPGNGALLAFSPGAQNTLNISAGSYIVAAPLAGSNITQLPYGSITVGSGCSFAIANGASHADRYLLRVETLTVNGSLDMGWSDLLVHGGDLPSLVSQIASGSIFSSAARADTTHLTALGIMQNSTDGTPVGPVMYNSFDNLTVVDTDVILKYTYWGDTNLDGRVDAADYSRIDNGYLRQLSGWNNGDFNDDGAVNGSDYTLIDNAFNTQGAVLTAEIANAQPTSMFANSGLTTLPALLAPLTEARTTQGDWARHDKKSLGLPVKAKADRQLRIQSQRSVQSIRPLHRAGKSTVANNPGSQAQMTLLQSDRVGNAT
jgi:hypothetical protein